ncbi:MAG TPA: DUF1848 domain-containing protein [Syntrophomonadaceae bacterium]|nr:DUF1848 domain-containing protein [Syntrophomonadaceae bacterium]HQA08508.1 DUF1848 domain-containing protein [Syntrophomonadaceae bacterium]HQE24226.1 DUF1848 domain-containing protein [Syntrophomonadaceae bacterium]
MIISASRRTDIPAFYSEWFMNRIRAGYCTTINPFNRKQVAYVSLKPEDVDVIVFWTKNPEPLIKHLEELDDRGFRYYFQYTLTGYPQALEPQVPELKKGISTFKKLADRIGPEKVIWRYDPIVISNITDTNYHKKQIDHIARELEGFTHRLVISIVDEYRKTKINFDQQERRSINIERQISEDQVRDIIEFAVDRTKRSKMEAFSCAEILNLKPFGLMPGKCIDDHYIKRVFGIDVTSEKDKSQRSECGCVHSKDIGAYDTCLHGCLYCYAGTLSAAKKNQTNHFPDSPSIIGRLDAEPKDEVNGTEQPALF